MKQIIYQCDFTLQKQKLCSVSANIKAVGQQGIIKEYDEHNYADQAVQIATKTAYSDMREPTATCGHISYYIISGILSQTDSASSVKLISIEAVNRIIRYVKPA